MPSIRSAINGVLLAAVFVSGCDDSDSPTNPAPDTGILSVVTATTGSNVDPDGYTVSVDGGSATSIGTNETKTFPGLTVGSHSVQLGGVTENCTVSGSNPRNETVTKDATTTTRFEITCTAPAPTLESILVGEGMDTVVIRIGESVSGVATGVYSDGSRKTIVGGTWTTGDANVATISADASGLATLQGVGEGGTTITVDYQGKRGTREVSVIPEEAPPIGGIAVGKWQSSGTNQDGSTYTICFNVAGDRTKLTATGSTCEGGAALVVQLGGLEDQNGDACTVDISTTGDVPLTFGVAFTFANETNGGGFEQVAGEFKAANAASGFADRQAPSAGPKCGGAWAVAPAGGEGGTGADLDLVEIDGTNLPFPLSTGGGVIVEVLSGELALDANGSFYRKTTTRTTLTTAGQVTTSSSEDGGTYTLEGQVLTLKGAVETLTGTFVGGEATFQITGRAWVYR